MKTQYKILATTMTAALFSGAASAATYAIEARSDAMGGVGTVSASYLTAPFFNPALAAIYRRNDDAGMIVPSFGINYNDQDDIIDSIERIGKMSPSDPNLENELKALNNKQASFDLGGVVAIGIPNKFLSATAYGKLYTESFVEPEIKDATDINANYVRGVSIGVAEAGISLAKYTNFMNQHLSFGITPKLQRIYTYSYATSFAAFDTKDLRENETAETMFNLDAGALWFFGPYRLGISAKNLIGRDVKTKSFTYNSDTIQSYEYSMRPVYTVGAGYVADYFSFSVDYDLNEEKKFSTFDDNTQMLRAGFEIDVLRQLALRGGYMKNVARSEDEGTITAGIGLSPLNLIEMDIAAQYTNENAMGASINFLATY
ncbi:conjugal transfer protein TraF [Vibrio owensii 47666-1]|uniref:conjugal transfer protein TraF n=1 Tax=Vibrio owensii TaxID=696485 RepID=UPI0005844B28|nr:conjugal transfer protein TraF [Vibrio owensii]KIF49524.1 conjugal transfer protein TraF [Vibrio owensii 47666-1]